MYKLICPMCGSKGKIIKNITAYGAKCTKCSFEIPCNFTYVAGAIIKWNEHVEYFKNLNNNINNNILNWNKIFPEQEGHYLIAIPPHYGIIIRYIGLLNNKWSTCYGPINYPANTYFYGPLPELPLDKEIV